LPAKVKPRSFEDEEGKKKNTNQRGSLRLGQEETKTHKMTESNTKRATVVETLHRRIANETIKSAIRVNSPIRRRTKEKSKNDNM